MPKDFICDICLKNFKTTQHLNQHKNRKNKCKPFHIGINHSSIPSQSPFGDISALTDTVNIDLDIMSNGNSNGNGNSNSNFTITNNMTTVADLSMSDLTKTTYNLLGSNTNGSTVVSIQSLIDLIIKNKTLLEQLRQLDNENITLKKRIEKMRMENTLYKKHNSVVETLVYKFVEDINVSIKKNNEYLYLSSLNDNECIPETVN